MKVALFSTKRLVILAMLTAMEIMLSRFCSISAWNMKIGFGFAPVAAAAILCGPLAGGLVGAASDFVGAILFPIGAYFPGFTVTAFLTGAAFGLFLHKKQTMVGILGAVAISQLILGLLLNTLWISVLYGSPYLPLMATRVLQCAILGPVQFAVIAAMSKGYQRYGKRVLA